MKEFPRDDAEWVEHLPTWAPGLFPGSKSHHRDDIEGGWKPTAEMYEAGLTPEQVFFNDWMAQHCAPFADIIGEYTRWLYGRERDIAIFKILGYAWKSCQADPFAFGTRLWLRRVCREALGPVDMLEVLS